MEPDFQEDFSSLKLNSKAGYQLLLTSSLYGTNFAIYGKFTIKKDGLKAVIEKIDTKIYNYKGILDLGFSTQHEPEVSLENNGKDSYVKIKFYIRAVVAGSKMINATTFTPLTSYNNKFKPQSEISISHPYFLQAKRELIPISGDINNPPVTNGVFDSEFYFRDGAHYMVRQVREIPNVLTPNLPIYNINDKLINIAGPGKTCRKSNLHLVFEK